jgi:hypothetical protein
LDQLPSGINFTPYFCVYLDLLTHTTHPIVKVIYKDEYRTDNNYSDYLLSSFGQTTATGLSRLLDGELSHDQVTRFLNRDDYDSKILWQHVKKAVREVESEDGVLIFDDTIQEEPYSDENELVCWHFDYKLRPTNPN